MHSSIPKLDILFLLRNSLFLFVFGIATPSLAGAHLTLNGSQSESNAGYQTIEAASLSAGIAFDLGQYMRLGYTHMQQLQASQGFACEKDDPGSEPDGNGGYLSCPTFQSQSHIIAHSIELTLILYAGSVMTPYISLGAGPRSYKITSKKGSGPEETDTGGGPTMNGAVGISFKLNNKFSLKLSYAMTGGVKKVPGVEKAKSTVDGGAQIGLQYSL